MDMEPPPSASDDEGSLGPGTETYHRRRAPLAGVAAGVTVAAGVAWACLRWNPSRIRIEGGSMAPTLVPGDWALVAAPARFERGSIVVVEHPERPGYEMVKRLTGIPGDAIGEHTLGADEWWVEGDLEAASTDSRRFGPVRREALKARVLLIYWPKERRALVR
jgi:nickel-type superoxide dismutase maturation protease